MRGRLPEVASFRTQRDEDGETAPVLAPLRVGSELSQCEHISYCCCGFVCLFVFLSFNIVFLVLGASRIVELALVHSKPLAPVMYIFNCVHRQI
ncbi:hypothetical protein SKAU_G00140860 [Synaphobranchus kaupii]|uniref:Uncharacterized protein n=1 Tax=Synaphobranchus kaupii TaxID=118154 RepID=A0A9Q1J4E3_SYNKA|nr:hypothetical protein SKAU_G00140860 [Synaphobranchus kaupii]